MLRLGRGAAEEGEAACEGDAASWKVHPLLLLLLAGYLAAAAYAAAAARAAGRMLLTAASPGRGAVGGSGGGSRVGGSGGGLPLAGQLRGPQGGPGTPQHLQGAAQHAADAPGGLDRGVCVARAPASQTTVGVPDPSDHSGTSVASQPGSRLGGCREPKEPSLRRAIASEADDWTSPACRRGALLGSIVFPTCAPSTPSETASCYHGPEGAHGGQLISAWLPCWARRRHQRLQPRTISCRPIAAAGSALGRDPRRAAAAAAAGSCHPTHSPFLPQTHNSHLCAFPPQEDFDRAAEEAKALPDGVTNDDKLAL